MTNAQWEQRRYEIARDMLVANYYNGMTAKEAVAYADALVVELMLSETKSKSNLNDDC